MQRNLKNLRSFIITTCLTVSLIIYAGNVVRPITDCDTCIDTINTFHDMPKNSFEVIGFGSSHMWKGVNAMEMYKSYGVGAYNYGANWQALNTTLLFMQDAFKTQSPKVVLIECFKVAEILKDTDVTGEIYYTRELPESREKHEYLKQCFGNDIERWLSYYMPLCAFHNNWINLTTESFMWNSSTTDYAKTMGSELWDLYGYAAIPNPNTFQQWELPEESIEILDQIVALCRKNNAEIIFFTTPHQGEYVYNNAMAAYAEANDCVYINMFESELLQSMDLRGEDFYDLGHTNTIGATKIANYLASYIVENYDVTDMRTIENNIWEQSLNTISTQ